MKVNPKGFSQGLAFFFAYAVPELEGSRDEAWKIFRQLLNRFSHVVYKNVGASGCSPFKKELGAQSGAPTIGFFI